MGKYDKLLYSKAAVVQTNGIDTVEVIPGAELMVIEGLGHGSPPVIWSRLIEAIARDAVDLEGGRNGSY